MEDAIRGADDLFEKGLLRVRVLVGDITEFDGDAIVNPANTLMLMGGGVAGAIRRKGGAEIEEEARGKAPVPIGRAVATGAGRLRCRYVIHAPTVGTPGGESSPDRVYLATRAALEEARRIGVRRVAFPLMGAGVGGVGLCDSVGSMARAWEELGLDLELFLYVLRDDVLREVSRCFEEIGFRASGEPCQ